MNQDSIIPLNENNSNIKLPEVTWLICANSLNELLKLALDSCFGQTFQNFEIILVANGPSANSIAVKVNEWFGSDLRLRILTTNIQQLTHSLNLGLSNARSNFIARMDADDISYPQRLQVQLDFMKNNSEVVVLGSAYDLIDENGYVKKVIHPPQRDMQIRRQLYFSNPLCHPSVMFRKEFVMNAGGYMGGLYAQDYDLWVRLSFNSEVIFANLEQVCLGYRELNVSNKARRSRAAYAAVSASQFYAFVRGFGCFWVLAATTSYIKAFIKARQD